MIYFINNDMQEKKSGIEHAQIKRAHLFDQHNYPYGLITQKWNRNLHRPDEQVGTIKGQYINMFDYFQQALDVESKFITLEDIDFGIAPLTYEEDGENNRIKVSRADGILLGYVHLAPDKRVDMVIRVDMLGNEYAMDYYDYRGFKSATQWLYMGKNGGNMQWYTPNGKVSLRSFEKLDGQGNGAGSGYLMTTKEGKLHQIDNFHQLFKFFLNAWNNETTTFNAYILDRTDKSSRMDIASLTLDKPAYVIQHIHNGHTNDTNKPWASILNDNYLYALQNAEKFDGFIVATEKQYQDMDARFEKIRQLFRIPVGLVSDATLAAPRIPMEKRQFGKIIVTARVAPEKKIDEIIKAIKLVHNKIPMVTLDIYGYDGSRDYRNSLDKLVEKLALNEVVSFKGYADDTTQDMQNAQIFLSASTMEGFALAVLEGIAQGTVGVTYDTNYGPNEIIQDGINGYVVPKHDYEALATKIIELLENPELLQQMSTGAYESAHRYSPASVWQQWEALFADIELVKGVKG